MPKLRESLEAMGGGVLFTEQPDQVYSRPLKQTSGVSAGGNEFTLQETDIQPYIDNPEMAQMEAEVTQARYGGTSIQDPGAQGPPGAMPAAAGGKSGPVDFSRRADFENSVFKQMITETMPDGNPFNFDPTASLNSISKSDLPELFATVFQNEVTWQDRHLLDDDQKKYWMSEVKRYRAHLSSSLESERESAVNQYNQMMNQFDNAAKEDEAQRRRERQTKQDFQTAKTKQSERQDKKIKSAQANIKRRSELLTKEREVIQAVFEAEANQTLTDTEKAAFATELQSMRDERKLIEAILNEGKVPKPKSAVTEVSDTGDKPAPEGERKSPLVVKKKMPKAGKTVVKTGTYNGRKVVKYSDGSVAYADETE